MIFFYQNAVTSSPPVPLSWTSPNGSNNNNNNNPNNNLNNTNSNTNMKTYMGYWGGTKNIIGIPSNDDINNGNKLMGIKADISEETYEVGIAKDIRALELRLESELELEEHEKLWSHPENSGLQK